MKKGNISTEKKKKENDDNAKKIPGDYETLTPEETKKKEEEEKIRNAQTPTGNERNSQGGVWQGPDTLPNENNAQDNINNYKDPTTPL